MTRTLAFSAYFKSSSLPSVLWHCWLSVRKSMWPVKIEWWGAGVVVCQEWGADCLHMVQLMPLHPQTLASFKRRPILSFWYRLTQTDNHNNTSIFYRPDALPDAQPTVLKHLRHSIFKSNIIVTLILTIINAHLSTCTHTHFMTICPGLPGWASTRRNLQLITPTRKKKKDSHRQRPLLLWASEGW